MHVEIPTRGHAPDYVRIDSGDLDTLDRVLATTILPALVAFRQRFEDEPSNIPHTLLDHPCDRPGNREQYEFDFIDTAAEYGALYETGGKRWAEILDQMIEAFRFQFDSRLLFHTQGQSEYTRRHERAMEGYRLFGQYFTSLYFE